MHTYIHTCVNSAHTHGINKEVECGKKNVEGLEKASSTSQKYIMDVL